jgi:hypothetical protein
MRRRQYLILGAAGAALLLSVFVFKRHLPYTGMPALPKQPPAVVMTMENAYLVGLGRGGKLWSLRANKVEVAQNRTTTILTGITHGNVYSGKAVAFSVQAGKAAYDSSCKSLVLSGGMCVQGRGQKVVLDGAVWNPSTATLSSTGPVVYQSAWGRLTANRLELNAKSKEVTFTQVGGRFHLNNAQDALQVGADRNAN